MAMINIGLKNYNKGTAFEQENKLEEAFEAYKSSAEAGNANAMWAIARLYLFKDFRKIKVNNLFQLIQQGIPVFPWNFEEHEEIDYRSALEWSIKAADADNAQAALAAGLILCGGHGKAPDIEKGLPYIKIALSRKVPGAEEAYALYAPEKNVSIDDSEYEKKLNEFAVCLNNGDMSSSMLLFSMLKNGSPTQKAKLGYVLMTGRNLGNELCATFPLLREDNGIPFFPAAPKRVAWKTFVRIDRNAFPEGAKILFSADINVTPDCLSGLVITGKCEYISPSFGWLGEKKQAFILEFDDSAKLSEELFERVRKNFRLFEPEYQPENVAFFVENGEKEYSVEIAALIGERIDILYRYTIGGSDVVNKYFDPELISTDYCVDDKGY